MSQTTKSSDVIHLVLTPWNLSDDYNRHAGATLLSLLENSSLPVVVHLLYDSNESKDNEDGELYNRKCYQKIADAYGCEIQFHNIEMPLWLKDVPAVKRWTPGSLMRLYLPDILTDVDKVLYLDCDVIVNLDVKELWDIDISEYYLAAVHPTNHVLSHYQHSKTVRNTFKNLNININNYFNAGMLILNLKNIRCKHPNFTNILFKKLDECRFLPYLDQDLLNWFCQGEYLELPEKYNLIASREFAISQAREAILHYAVPESKPWKRYSGEIDDYYWRYVVKTPWFDDKEMMLEYVRAAPDIKMCLDILPDNILRSGGAGYLNKLKYISQTLIKFNMTVFIKGLKALVRK